MQCVKYCFLCKYFEEIATYLFNNIQEHAKSVNSLFGVPAALLFDEKASSNLREYRQIPLSGNSIKQSEIFWSFSAPGPGELLLSMVFKMRAVKADRFMEYKGV